MAAEGRRMLTRTCVCVCLCVHVCSFAQHAHVSIGEESARSRGGRESEEEERGRLEAGAREVAAGGRGAARAREPHEGTARQQNVRSHDALALDVMFLPRMQYEAFERGNIFAQVR